MNNECQHFHFCGKQYVVIRECKRSNEMKIKRQNEVRKICFCSNAIGHSILLRLNRCTILKSICKFASAPISTDRRQWFCSTVPHNIWSSHGYFQRADYINKAMFYDFAAILKCLNLSALNWTQFIHDIIYIRCVFVEM